MRRLAILLAALLIGALVQAQELAPLLPADTKLAFGVQDLETATGTLDPVIEEWHRMELTSLLVELFPEEAEELDRELRYLEEDAGDILEQLEGLSVMDALGQEAWFAVSTSSYNPMPSVSFLAKPTSALVVRLTAILDDLLEEFADDVEVLREGDYTFYVAGDDYGMPGDVTAFSVSSELLAFSTNPDVLRGILRRLGGADEPNLAASAGYGDTIGALGPGNFYSFIDYTGLSRTAETFAMGFGFDEAADRLLRAGRTFGTSGNVIRMTPSGFVSEGRQRLERDTGDESLLRLLTPQRSVDLAGLRFVPADALGYSISTTDLAGWWGYLNELAASVPELGGDLNMLILAFTGIDLEDAFFAWTEPGITTATIGLGEVAAPGMPVDNFFGDIVYALRVNDEDAAQAGLDEIFALAAMMLGGFADPMGMPGEMESDVEEIAGVTATHYDLAPGVAISYAVTDGHVLFATSRRAMSEALEATEPPGLPVAVPENATSVAFTDTRRTLEGTAVALRAQLEMAVGLAGPAIDFDAVTRASDAIEEFVHFLASRAGDSIGYSVVTEDGVYSYSETEFAW